MAGREAGRPAQRHTHARRASRKRQRARFTHRVSLRGCDTRPQCSVDSADMGTFTIQCFGSLIGSSSAH